MALKIFRDIVLLCLVLGSNSANAVNSKFLSFKCMSGINAMSLVPFHVDVGYPAEISYLQSEYGLYIEQGEGMYSCQLKDTNIKVQYSSTSPRASGMCGYGTHSKINLYVGSRLILEELTFDPDCFKSGVSNLSIIVDRASLLINLEMHSELGVSPSAPRKIYRDTFYYNMDKHTIPISMDEVDRAIKSFQK